MKNKRQLLFRICAVAIVLAIAAAMFVIGRGHTVYFDNKETDYQGQKVQSFYKVTIVKGGERVAKLSAGDRGTTDIMGQTLTMTVEITDQKDAQPHAHKVSMNVPYNMDGIIINIPALMAGLPQDAYLSEFIITAPAEEEDDSQEEEGIDMGEF